MYQPNMLTNYSPEHRRVAMYNGPLFHGTQASLKPGDKILPGETIGFSPSGTHGQRFGETAKKFAWATEDEATAWQYAERDSKDRPRVYSVAPHPEMKQGYYHDELWEHFAPHFTVQSAHDIAPGRPGTIPNINWAQFATAKYPGDEMRYNHPKLGDQPPPSMREHWSRTDHENEAFRNPQTPEYHPPMKGQQVIPGLPAEEPISQGEYEYRLRSQQNRKLDFQRARHAEVMTARGRRPW